jgi:hypothetical protein
MLGTKGLVIVGTVFLVAVGVAHGAANPRSTRVLRNRMRENDRARNLLNAISEAEIDEKKPKPQAFDQVLMSVVTQDPRTACRMGLIIFSMLSAFVEMLAPKHIIKKLRYQVLLCVAASKIIDLLSLFNFDNLIDFEPIPVALFYLRSNVERMIRSHGYMINFLIDSMLYGIRLECVIAAILSELPFFVRTCFTMYLATQPLARRKSLVEQKQATRYLMLLKFSIVSSESDEEKENHRSLDAAKGSHDEVSTDELSYSAVYSPKYSAQPEDVLDMVCDRLSLVCECKYFLTLVGESVSGIVRKRVVGPLPMLYHIHIIYESLRCLHERLIRRELAGFKGNQRPMLESLFSLFEGFKLSEATSSLGTNSQAHVDKRSKKKTKKSKKSRKMKTDSQRKSTDE